MKFPASVLVAHLSYIAIVRAASHRQYGVCTACLTIVAFQALRLLPSTNSVSTLALQNQLKMRDLKMVARLSTVSQTSTQSLRELGIKVSSPSFRWLGHQMHSVVRLDNDLKSLRCRQRINHCSGMPALRHQRRISNTQPGQSFSPAVKSARGLNP